METTYNLVGFSKGLNQRMVKFMDKIPSHLVCSLCGLVPSESVRLPCSHMYCPCCYKDITNKNEETICPLDSRVSYLNEIYSDQTTSNILWEYEVFCGYKKNGCCAVMTLSDYEDHLFQCDFMETSCQRCSKTLPRQFLFHHVEKGCQPSWTTKSSSPEADRVINVNSLIMGVVRSNEILQNHKVEVTQLVDHHVDRAVRHLENRMQDMISSLQQDLRCTINAKRSSDDDLTSAKMGEVLKNLQSLETSFEDSTGQTADAIRDVKQSVVNIENIVTCTRYNWLISTFSSLVEDAQETGLTSQSSDSFFIGTDGYKMSLLCEFRRSPIDEEPSSNVFLGLYMILEKGPNDSVLQWPYQRKSSAQLVNFSNSFLHKTIQFEPLFCTPEAKSSLCRPAQYRNRGLGFSRIISAEELMTGGYVKDDSLTIIFSTSGI